VPHPHIAEFVRIQFHEVVEELHLRYEHLDGLQCLAKLKRERDTVPEIVVPVVALIPDVELKFGPSRMMERPVIKRRVSAEDVVTRPALQSFNCVRMS
jgi:hypothetical protein